jgi:hypothetical protein
MNNVRKATGTLPRLESSLTGAISFGVLVTGVKIGKLIIKCFNAVLGEG